MNNLFRMLILTLSFTLISLNLSLAQSNWYYQNPLPQGNNLQGVFFVDDYIGTAIGDYGTILRTTDGGLTWKKQNSGVTNFLYSAFFTDANRGHVVGTSGVVLRTTDGGNTWTSQTIGTVTNHYSGLYFINHNLGWTVGAGGTVLRTTDSGVSWSLIYYGGTSDSWLQGVFFTDSLNGFVTGNVNGTLRRTTDGGFTWTDIPSGETGPLYKVTFTDKHHGIAVGGQYGTILRTTDSGISWDRQVLYTPGILYGVSFINSQIGFAAGNHGVIVKTTDGGITWLNQTSNTTISLREIAVGKNSTIAYTVGGNGRICKSSDLGETWENSFSVTNNTLFRVSFSDINHGTAVGVDGVIARTTNSGFSWFQQVSGTSNHLRDVTLINQNIGIAVGDNGTIIKTTNGGEMWFNQSSGVTMNIRSVSFADENNGLAVGATLVGSAGKIIKTTDGGANWITHSDVTGNLYGVSFPDPNHATVVGQQGKIWRTNDGGLTWVLQSSPTNRNLNAVCFTDSNKGIAVGQVSEIIRTTDGGNSWALQTFGSTATLNDVSFYGENFGITVGTADGISTTVLRTIDGGLTWTRDPIDMWRTPSGVHCINEQASVMVIGGATAGGAILRRGVPPLPSEPSDLFAIPDTFFINLSWSDNSIDETGFVVERKITDSTGNNSFVFLASVGANMDTYTDTGLTPNTDYSYRIYAYNGYGGSEYSNIVEITTIIPVELTSFTAISEGNKVRLNWSTATETNNQGFEIERNQRTEVGNQKWEKIGYVNGSGTTTEPKLYTFIDEKITTGIFSYRLKQVDFDGKYTFSPKIEIEVDFIPKEYALFQNYPNPFNPSTTIKYALPFRSSVILSVYNILGEKVSELINDSQESGYYEFLWNAENIASGIYLYNMQAKSIDGQMNYTSVKKMIIVK